MKVLGDHRGVPLELLRDLERNAARLATSGRHRAGARLRGRPGTQGRPARFARGARIFHDVPAESFNLDHVVISTHGIYVVETKTITKPSADAKVIYDGERVTVAGHSPDRDPVRQAAAEAYWLRQLLNQSTGRDFPVRGVVVHPRWWIEQTNKDRLCEAWVLEPKALPKWIENAPAVTSAEDVAMAAYHLSRYVQGENR